MNKKAFFSVIFIVISFGVCLLIANEYLKRVEIKAINSYLSTLKGEIIDKQVELDFSQVLCSGFFKHSCKISNISLNSRQSPILQDSKIKLTDTSLTITDLNTQKIALAVKIGAISQTKMFLPKNFAYTISLTKQDSTLGYVMLNRVLNLDIGNVAVSVNFAVLIREKRFRNKSVLFLLKEWIDPDTPSFYEFSLESLDISLKSKNAVNTAFYEANSKHLQYLLDNLNITKPHFERLKNATISLTKNEISSIDFSVKRKNKDLVFFNTLSDSATTKKTLEIREILDSINDSYAVELKIDKDR